MDFQEISEGKVCQTRPIKIKSGGLSFTPTQIARVTVRSKSSSISHFLKCAHAMAAQFNLHKSQTHTNQSDYDVTCTHTVRNQGVQGGPDPPANLFAPLEKCVGHSFTN